jgi:glycosyltransferase involved in cell wall biosynthesis
METHAETTGISNLKKHSSQATVALMPCGDLFEDFFDTIGVSFEALRTEQAGGWMFNYIEALQLAKVQTILIFISARVSETLRFTHVPTGATVCILPAPLAHRIFRWITRGKLLNTRAIIRSLDSYLVLPLLRLIRELWQYERCAVLFQDYENPSFDICVLLGKFLRVAVFATFQGGNTWRSRVEQPIRYLTMRGCTGLVIGSETEIQRVQNQYRVPQGKIARIFNPTDMLTLRPFDRKESRSALGISLTARVVISHGRISMNHKGLDLLLECWQQVCRKRSDRELCLLLVGTGEDSPKLHAQIETMKLETVLWVDEYIRDRTRLWQYLSTADVYAMASRHEGFPVAPIEAMACELPVVATDVPGIAEILKGGEASGGFVVPRGDTTALAMALENILDDEQWGWELGKRARRRAEECFSLEVIGQQMREFLFTS